MNRKLGQQRLKAAEQVVAFCKRMVDDGLTHATGGNISVRVTDTEEFAVSPSAVEYRVMSVEDVPIINAEGLPVAPARYGRTPSTELGMHLAAYRALPSAKVVIHTHSPYATTLACMEKPLPPIHYLVCSAGEDVPCIPYHPFGSEELAQAAGAALDERHRAVLLGHHGLLVCGDTVYEAYTMAADIEFCCQLYIQALAAGSEPQALTPDQVDQAMSLLRSYHQFE